MNCQSQRISQSQRRKDSSATDVTRFDGLTIMELNQISRSNKLIKYTIFDMRMWSTPCLVYLLLFVLTGRLKLKFVLFFGQTPNAN